MIRRRSAQDLLQGFQLLKERSRSWDITGVNQGIDNLIALGRVLFDKGRGSVEIADR